LTNDRAKAKHLQNAQAQIWSVLEDVTERVRALVAVFRRIRRVSDSDAVEHE